MTENGPAKYTVIELSELLGVKRTTVNDWLSKYALYIEFSVQGKRRIYTDAALNVLKKVAELRGNGLSSFEIDAELAKTYAVHPQPETPPPAEEDEQPAPSTQKDPVPVDPGAVAIRRDAGELLRRFEEMMAKIDRLEETARALPPPPPAPAPAPRHNGFMILTLILIVLILAGGGALFFYGHRELNAVRHSSELQAQELARQRKTNDELRNDVFVLDSTRRDFEQNVQRLEQEVAREKQARDKQAADAARELAAAKSGMEELRKSDAARFEAERKLESERFQKERLELMHQLELQRHAAEKAASEKKVLELEKAMAEKRAADAEKASAPVPAKKEATPAPVKKQEVPVKKSEPQPTAPKK